MEKVKKLRQVFKRELIDGYLIPKNDEFFGENIEKQKDRLNFISNFSGSFGLSLILKNKSFAFCGFGLFSKNLQANSTRFVRS